MSWPRVAVVVCNTGHTAGDQCSASRAMNENGHAHASADPEDIRLVEPDLFLGEATVEIACTCGLEGVPPCEHRVAKGAQDQD
jgi:hypothetical protein